MAEQMKRMGAGLMIAAALAFSVGEARADSNSGAAHLHACADLDASFAQVDANGNGMIEFAEIDAFSAVFIKEADGNGDGVVTFEEYQAWDLNRLRKLGAFGAGSEKAHRMVAERQFASKDRNRDGVLDAAEFGFEGALFAKQMDTDMSRTVSKEEWVSGNGGCK